MVNKQVYLIALGIFIFVLSNRLSSQIRQEIDSVLNLNIKETNKINLVNNYNYLAGLYAYDKIDSAYFYAKKALDNARKTGYKQGEAEAYYQLAYFDERTAKIESAIENQKKATEIYSELGDSSYLVGCYNNLGVFYSYSADQKTSLEYFIKAMNLAEQLNESYALSEAYLNIGSYYEYLKEYVTALKYYTKALEVDLKAENLANIPLWYLTIGNVNLKLQRYEAARDSLLKAKEYIFRIEDSYRITEIYIGLANYYVETGQADTAQYYIQLAKETNNNQEYNRLNADILMLEGDLLFMQRKFAECLVIYDKAIEIYLKQNALENLYEIYISKSTALSEVGKYEKAYEILQDAQRVNEEYKPHEIAKTLGEFEQSEAIKEEKVRLKLEQEILRQKSMTELVEMKARLQLAVISIVFLVVIVLIFVYFYVLKRKHNLHLAENYRIIQEQKSQLEENFLELKQSEEKLTKVNATKDRFFSIIAHDLKNPFNVLIGLSDIVISNPEVRDSEDFEEIIDGIFQTAKSGYSLLENLLEWARSQTGEIEFKPAEINISDVVKINTTLFSESAKSKSIELTNTVKNEVKVIADFNMINFIVRNLLNNAIKFSYQNKRIIIKTEEEDNFIVISVRDYGIGMSKETIEKLFRIESTSPLPGTSNETGTGLGLIICKEFVEKNGGNIWVESKPEEGSCFFFSIPQTINK